MTDPLQKKVIALFDFDGTITTKDSLMVFLIYNFGWVRFFFVLLLYLPIHLIYKGGLISSTAAKNFLFPFFFKGLTGERFAYVCQMFCKNELPKIINAQAQNKIQWHLQSGHEVVIVSASVYDWIEPWASLSGINKIISSNIEITKGKLTGKLSGKNCNDEEKVARVKTEIPGIDNYEIYAYGNSSSDRFMLAMANKKFYRKFEE